MDARNCVQTILVKVKDDCWKQHVNQLLDSQHQGSDEQVEDTDSFEAVAGQETNQGAEAEITGTELSDESLHTTGEDQDALTTESTVLYQNHITLNVYADPRID